MSRRAWALAHLQHWTITTGQLLDIGYSEGAIAHRLRIGRLFRKYTGVFAVGRPDLDPLGEWKAAELAIGGEAGIALEHAAALLEMTKGSPGVPIALAVPLSMDPDVPGLETHRRVERVMQHVIEHRGVRVTSPACTLVDLAARWTQDRIEAAISRADKLDIIRADDLRVELEQFARVPGVSRLRATLDRHTFVLTDSRLERLFRPIARRAGLGLPETQKHFGTNRVDFFFPDWNLVVECDGLRYHRTAAQQTKDLRREQEHWAAGRERQRFSHAQVRYEAAHVEDVLTRTRIRLQTSRTPDWGKPST